MSRIVRFAFAILAFIAPALAHAVTASQTGTVLSISLGSASDVATISHGGGNVIVKSGATVIFSASTTGISSVTVTSPASNTTVTFSDGFDAPLGITVSNVWFANFTGAFNVDTGGISASALLGATVENAQFTSSTGALNITGNTGSGAGGPGADGLLINQSSITSTSGNISLRGVATGGSGTKSGVHIASSQISTAGAGTLSVSGQGNRSTTDTGNSDGLLIDGATSTVSTVNGSLQLTGTGGTGSSTPNAGIAIHDGAQVSSTGNGLVDIIGTGGGTGASTNNDGIDISGAPSPSVVSALSTSNLLFLEGTAGVGVSSSGISIGSSGFGTIKSSDLIEMVADSMDIPSGATIDGGINTVLLAPKTASVAIDLGGADAPGTLGLSSAKLGRITAKVISIGQASQVGPITISAPITLPATDLELETLGPLGGPGPVSTTRLTLFEVPSGTLNRTWVVGPGVVTRDSATPINFSSPILTLDGGGGNDAFTVTPFPGTIITVVGGNPTSFPGDSLTIVPGALNPVLTSTPSASGYSGTMTFSNAGLVRFFTIETGTVALAAVNVTLPATAQAGVPVNVAVAVVDALGTVASSYTGVVHFTSSDPSAVLPATTTLVNGVGTFPVTFNQLGNATFTASDTVTSSLTGNSSVQVGPGDATHFTVSAPSTATAGSPFSLTVTALDAFNNVATGYTGTVHFSSSDGSAILPADATLLSGAGSFNATLVLAGTATIVATDIVGGFNGFSNPIAVAAGPATHLSLTAPANAIAGVVSTFTVTALDAFNNVSTGYAGTVHFTSSDGRSQLPANAVLVGGTGSFNATLKTAGTQTITATDTVAPSVAGTSSAITVASAAASHLTVSAPGSLVAGTTVSITVTAFDAFNNVATSYGGTVRFTTTDPVGILAANSTLSSGTGTFSATLKTVGSQTITATDTVSGITGTTGTIGVSPTVTVAFVVAAPASATAGTASTFTVTAMDPYNNLGTNYTGAVHFTSTDAAATLPANATLTNGVGTFTATLKTSGTQTLTATDTANSLVTGTSGAIAIAAGPATHITVTAPAGATSNTAISINVIAADTFNNTATSYAGTVHFTSSDTAAVLPANSTLTTGAGTFSATLKTSGSQTIMATDTTASSITGVSGPITVGASGATHLLINAPASASGSSGFSVTVTALDQADNVATNYAGTIHFTSTDPQSALPADITLVNGVGTFTVTLRTGGLRSITAADTVNGSITGTASVSVVVNSYSAPSATGTGTITATFTGGGSSCSFAAPQFIGAPPGSPPVPPTLPSADTRFPEGMFDFSLTGCTSGSTITMTITYPQQVAGMRYWKYGPEASNTTPHWYVMPATLSGNTAVFSITDGAQGDDDLAANGVIVDQGGPGFAPNGVPTMSWWMLLLMALGLVAIGWRWSGQVPVTRS